MISPLKFLKWREKISLERIFRLEVSAIHKHSDTFERSIMFTCIHSSKHGNVSSTATVTVNATSNYDFKLRKAANITLAAFLYS